MDIILNISSNRIDIISSTEKIVFEDVKDIKEIWEILYEVLNILDVSKTKLIVTNDTSITKVEEW